MAQSIGQFDGPSLAGAWHVYEFEWTPTAMVWRVDGFVRHTFSPPDVLDEDCYLTLNLGVGGASGDPSGLTLPAEMLVDYVTVWQQTSAVFSGEGTLSASGIPQGAGAAISQGIYDAPSSLAGAWHTFELEWAEGSLIWRVDGVVRHSFTSPDVLAEDCYLTLNLGVGGAAGPATGAVMPADMMVDRVYVWKMSDNAAFMDVAASGAGALSWSAVVSTSGQVAAVGAGSLSTVGSPQLIASRNHSGLGALSTTGLPSFSDAPSHSGTGSLSAVGIPRPVAIAGLDGSGSLVGTEGAAPVDSIAFTGFSQLVLTGVMSPQFSGSISGAGELTTGGAPSPTATADVTGSGTLSAIGVPSVPVDIAPSGSGTLSVDGVPSIPQPATLAGTGGLAAVGVPAVVTAVQLAGDGSLSGLAAGEIPFAGSGELTSTATPGIPAAADGASGSGSLVAQGVAAPASTANFTGSGSSESSGTPAITGTAPLTGDALLAFAALVALAGSAAFAGSGASSGTFEAPGQPRDVEFHVHGRGLRGRQGFRVRPPRREPRG